MVVLVVVIFYIGCRFDGCGGGGGGGGGGGLVADFVSSVFSFLFSFLVMGWGCQSNGCG